ncbi:hypothetical protein Ocin01_13971 [Orchesella cincta]|uniref:Uncharacterized protein n=1 Tax=Orchesella cincta TaxID=48709 RepID=A0A1D2MIB2_ORCCI|nr:hypothetical protein Ocin01_13971 [Orchesella cincta]
MLNREKEKTASKKGKGDKTKGKANKNDKTNKDNSNDDAISVMDSASDTTGGNPAVKLRKLEAPKKLTYGHIMNLESVLSMLQKLYASEQDKGALTQVYKENKDFENFLLSIVKEKFKSFKNKEPLNERSRRQDKVVRVFAEIASSIEWTYSLILIYPTFYTDTLDLERQHRPVTV